jgi:predicted small secreted protein
MKKIILIGISVMFAAASLVGCSTMNAVDNTGRAVVNTGVGVVSGVGYAATRVVGAGVNVVTSPFRSYHKPMHHTYYHHTYYHH